MHTLQRPNYSLLDHDVLVERIIQLEDELGRDFEIHPRYNLTTSEMALLGAIYGTKGVCSKDHAYTVLYGMHDDPPEQKIMDVFVCKLRRKLRPHGVEIKTIWGRGWYLEEEDRAKVENMRFKPASVGEAA